MSNLSKKERRRLRLEKMRAASERQRLEHEQMNDEREQRAAAESRKKQKKSVIMYSVVSILVILIAYSAYSSSVKPGKFDDFAKCLTEKGAVMYGADWCKYTQEQRGMFGKSFKHLDYRDYQDGSDIKLTPTWIINGKRYERVQSFDRLATLTGCNIFNN